ncbi:MAG: zinc ribbon domain-containing protein, partial [Ktedonobacteraceae bacterium]
MDARFYNTEEIDFEKLAIDLENMFRMQGYEVQHFGDKDQMMVQLKKGGDLVALIGLQTALSVTFQHTSGGSAALIGQQKWMDKAAVGAVGLIAFPVLWPLMITAGAGAVKQAALSNQVLGTVDSLVMQQVPGTHAGPIPGTMMPQFQQYWGAPPSQYGQPMPTYVPPTPVYTPPTPVYTPPAPAKPRCPTCNTNYEPGDTFCSGCGRPLTPPKRVCTSCNSEVKPGVAFCPNCGASTFQSTQAAPAKPASTPRPRRPETPVYTPPATPTYTPPRPSTPVYTPPTPVYTPPKPVEPEPYVPPVPKDPLVVPQPSVTLVPGKPKPATPPTPPPAPRVPVYTPPTPVQPPTVAANPPTPVYMPPPAPTIKAQPTDQSATDSSAAWGQLVFSNGREFSLADERILVGRYDHDLGGVQPEVDLGSME